MKHAQLAGFSKHRPVRSHRRKDTGSLEAWAGAETDEQVGQEDQLPMRVKLVKAV